MLVNSVKATEWVEVKRFESSVAGGYVIPTEFFEIRHVEWRVRWEYIPWAGVESYKPTFYVEVVSLPEWRRGDDARYLDYIYSIGTEQTSGTLYLHENKDRYYRLEISAKYIEYVILIVEEDTESIPEFPSFLILSLFMLATLLSVIVYKRKHTVRQI
jgi:hypothetical protein